jgi:hypothetical protein
MKDVEHLYRVTWTQRGQNYKVTMLMTQKKANQWTYWLTAKITRKDGIVFRDIERLN